ncbi:15380_t:CDS:2, partial [Cetraspora pellucida]
YHYEELSNGKGFIRVRNCAPIWQPFAMIDKHQPTKQELQPILHSLILCWFNIMQTFSLGEAYKTFIKFLPLTEITKEFLCNDIVANWLSEEWIDCFIDSGRMPSLNDVPDVRPMTTNNLTKRMNKSIEDQCIGTQPINFKPVVKELDTYFYVKKGNNKFRSPYTMRDIYIDNKLYQLLKPMLDKLASKHPIEQQDNYYLVNISTSESHLFNDVENKKITLDFIKHDLVLYFRNKERAMPNKQKNFIIYNNSIDAAFVSSVGAPKVHGTKLRKSNGFVPTENKE